MEHSSIPIQEYQVLKVSCVFLIEQEAGGLVLGGDSVGRTLCHALSSAESPGQTGSFEETHLLQSLPQK